MLEIGIFSAFIAGILSFISPCVLPLVPVYIGIMSRNVVTRDETVKFPDKLYIFLNSLLFVLGFSIVFIILGSTASFIGQILKNYLNIISRAGGVILIIFGLVYVGLFKVPFLNMERKFNMPSKLKSGFLWSFLFGIIFSFGWVPCVGMILSAILLLASRMETLLQGVLLLIVYCAGLGLPFIAASLFLGFFTKFLKKFNRHLNIISIISGIFLIVLGTIFVTDYMTKIIGFLAAHVPFLSKINF